jgi:hypothetical protein
MSKTYISAEIRRRVAEIAQHRCGYCLTQTLITGVAMQLEHIIPEAFGGASTESNLWLACATCNLHKAARTSAIDPETAQEVALFNPRQQLWSQHFVWSEDGTHLLGITAIGRATVEALQVNNDHIVKSRLLWVAAGWHPPADR